MLNIIFLISLALVAQVKSQTCTLYGSYSQNYRYNIQFSGATATCREYRFGKLTSSSYITLSFADNKIPCTASNVIVKNEAGTTVYDYCNSYKTSTSVTFKGNYLTVDFIYSSSIATNMTLSTSDLAPQTVLNVAVPPFKTNDIYYKTTSTCGESVFKNNISDTGVRIIGGTDALPNSWPWQVLIYDSGSLCGGSLINNQWILTAAHCNANLSSTASIYLGAHDRSALFNAVGINTVKKISHQSYSHDTLQNDIALYKLATPVNYTNTIRPVCLPDASYVTVGKSAVVTGWGKVADAGSVAGVLQQVAIPIRPLDQCGFDIRFLSNNQFCAGITGAGAKDSCQGDSGGPLVTRESDKNQYVLDGVVSFGGSSCDGNGIYTNVYNFIPWIKDTISKN